MRSAIFFSVMLLLATGAPLVVRRSARRSRSGDALPETQKMRGTADIILASAHSRRVRDRSHKLPVSLSDQSRRACAPADEHCFTIDKPDVAETVGGDTPRFRKACNVVASHPIFAARILRGNKCSPVEYDFLDHSAAGASAGSVAGISSGVSVETIGGASEASGTELSGSSVSSDACGVSGGGLDF